MCNCMLEAQRLKTTIAGVGRERTQIDPREGRRRFTRLPGPACAEYPNDRVPRLGPFDPTEQEPTSRLRT